METYVKQRHKSILDHLEEHGACSYQELSDRFGVTTMTIRRDVARLASQGLVIKTLGGVQKAGAPSYYYESTLWSRVKTHHAEKRAIAECAIDLVDAGKTIFLDGSTTCLQFAKLLAQHRKGLTIVTNSALIALELSKNSANMVVGIGGQIDKDTASFVGPSAEVDAKKFFVDLAFMSTKGFIPEEGTFESSVGNLHIKQLIVSQCAKVALLVDHSKFGVRALCKAIDASQIQVVVTDDATPDIAINFLKQQNKEVHVAACLEQSRTCEEVVNAP
jgi:DeoR/GlpR family transcriptional regulator of sugar metabolism